MNHDTPRPLPSARLAKLISGLKTRFSSSALLMAEQVDRLDAEIKLLHAQFDTDLLELEHANRCLSDTTTTQWDEERNACWDDCELRTFKAVHESRAKERSIVSTAKADSDQVNHDAKARLTEIERRYARSIEAAGNKLSQFRSQIELVRRSAEKIKVDGDSALAKHSLNVASHFEKLEPAAIGDSTQSLQLAKNTLQSALQCVHRLHHLPMSSLMTSVWWWLICLVVVSAGVATPMLLGYPILFALPVGAGLLVFTVLAAMLGIRPWMKKAAATEYPKLLGLLDLAEQYLRTSHEMATNETDSEQKRVAAKREKRIQELNEWQREQLRLIQNKAESELATVRAKAKEDKQLAAQSLTQGCQKIDQAFIKLNGQQQADSAAKRQAMQSQLEDQVADLLHQKDRLLRGGALRLEVSTQKALNFLTRHRRWCDQAFPDWPAFLKQPAQWPKLDSRPLLPVGILQLQQHLDLKPTTPNITSTDESTSGVQPQQNVRTLAGLGETETTLLFSPLTEGYLVIHADPALPSVRDLVRNLLLRALTTLPAGKTQLCIVDPPGLGRDFGWLMQLGDFDPAMVSHRVWTQSGHIAKQLQNLALGAEDFIQQSLRNQYANIVEFNADAGALAEPFRLLVWSSLPSGMDDQSWKSLQSLLDTGARCGIIPILIVDPALPLPQECEELIARRGMHLRLGQQGKWIVDLNFMQPDGYSNSSIDADSKALTLEVQIEQAASDSITDQMLAEVGRRALAGSRVEVPLSNLIASHPSNRWQGNSSRMLEIPLGQSGVGRVQSMKLGVGTAQHAVIAGKTGSGKSSMLHAMITSALMKYSPDNLRLVLLDFKKGVEFQIYADAHIPHADIIGIESHREFGLSALEYIDDCLQRRGEMFRKAGVQDIASWNAVHPQQAIPRVLLVVDEFQELFVEDDKLSQMAGQLLDRIVRQGRSFGVHAVLSSQTLVGSYSIPRTTLGQMAVRIALQCDPADAQVIFTEDNPAAARLKYPGQAVYNDAGGRIEGNQPMQIGWLDKATQIEWFSGFPYGYQNSDTTTNRLGRTVIFDGNRPATWESAQADMAISVAKKQLNPQALWCVVGESVTISPAVVFPLTNQAGRNVLMVGGEDAMAAAVLHALTASAAKAAAQQQQHLKLYTIQGAKPTDSNALQLSDRWSELPCDLKRFDIRDVDQGISQVHQLLQSRINDQASDRDPVLVHLIQIGRLRTLRRADEFSFGGSDSTPDKQLEDILRDGPSHSIHVVIWAENLSTANRWLSRNALRECEIRLLMQMSANDSSTLIDSNSAARLGDHVMLLFDEATGVQQKFRPYSNDSLASARDWLGTVQSTPQRENAVVFNHEMPVPQFQESQNVPSHDPQEPTVGLD